MHLLRRSLCSHFCAKCAQGKLPLLAALNVIMNSNVIEIGKFEEQRPGYKHPYWVYIDMANEEAPIAVAEGTGYHGVGCNLKPQEVVSEKWQEHLEKCGCSALSKLINSLINNGNAVTPQSIKELWFGQ
ncbi:hypothetical protein KUV95_17055 [Microbulbifer agarilyticus]|uniref:hypothetical protein n=1 Tax=Microbulbifer agarilyticus TaxID=260552 RepID=UPI001C943458|nr:hypothetical protein [Microbulbifer agarilyticus]MBY6213259.1 hypothetical protein [Microbulbifer agarilyticus]